MIAKILIPVVDLRRANFNYGRNITMEEAEYMEIDKFNRTNRQIGNYVDSMRYRADGWNGYVQEARGRRDNFSNVIDDEDYVECECDITDSKKNDIGGDFFELHNDGKKFILTINMNLTSSSVEDEYWKCTNLGEDDRSEQVMEAESEIRYWRDDSRGVLDDRTLDNQTKIERLMERDFGLIVGENKIKLCGCKIIRDYSNEKFPYYYGVLVNNIDKF